MGVSYFLWASMLCALAGCIACVRLYLSRPAVTPEQLAEARKDKKLMEGLVAHPGWIRLAAAAKAQADSRSNQVLLQPTENPYDQEYKKGEIQGIRTFLAIPETLISSAKDILALEPESDEADED